MGHYDSCRDDPLPTPRTVSIASADLVIQSAERIEAAYRVNLSEAELRRWSGDAVKVIRALTARAVLSQQAPE